MFYKNQRDCPSKEAAPERELYAVLLHCDFQRNRRHTQLVDESPLSLTARLDALEHGIVVELVDLERVPGQRSSRQHQSYVRKPCLRDGSPTDLAQALVVGSPVRQISELVERHGLDADEVSHPLKQSRGQGLGFRRVCARRGSLALLEDVDEDQRSTARC